MISRRNLLILSGFSIAGLALFKNTRPVHSSNWKQIKNGESIVINGVSYEAECGQNPTAIQLSNTGIVRFLMLPDNGWENDAGESSERTELDGWRNHVPVNKPVWLAWSMFLEPGPPSTADWMILGQIYQVGGSPVVHVLKPDGRLHWVGEASNEQSDWPSRHNMKIHQGEWLNFVETLKFDPLGGKGYWKSWVNGKPVLDYRGSFGSKGAEVVYPKFGIYRDKFQTWNGVDPIEELARTAETTGIRFANIRFGTSDLSKLIHKPDPIPAWQN